MKKLFWLIPLFCMACKPRVNSSEVKHTFGHTRRAPVAEIQSCRGKSLKELRPGARAEIPEATAYVRRIATQIMQSNPDTFRDAYAPDQICLFVTSNDGLNAEASHELRTIIFHAGLLQVADNDANVASVIAHELAHITMQHTHASTYEDLFNHSEWKTKGTALEHQLKNLQKKADATWENQNQLNLKFDALSAELDRKATTDIREQREKLQEQEQKIQSDIFAKYDDPALSLENAMNYQTALGAVTSATIRRPANPDDLAILLHTFADKTFSGMLERVKAHNKDVEALNALERKKLPTERKQLDQIVEALVKAPLEREAVYLEISNTQDQIKALQKSLVGDALYNWAEEEADDVGLELYLRAGWSPAFYSEIFRKKSLTSSEDSASCRAQLDAGHEPTRGVEFHPTDCWRVYNATIQEMKQHKTPYENFIKTATRQTLEKGTLSQLKTMINK